jgi:hypothetical protein
VLPNKPTPQEWLKVSAEWIDRHPKAMTRDVPDEILDVWTDDPCDENGLSEDFQFEVFLYGFLRFQQREMEESGAKEAHIPDRKVSDCFDGWRIKLALEKIHRGTKFQVEPVVLFGFPPSEDVRITVRPDHPE